MTRSQWQSRTDSGALRADLLIVGAGVAGLSALVHATRAGLDALLIEREHVAFGASGRNAGYLMTGADDNYAAAIRGWGRETAREMWGISVRTLEGLRSLGVADTPGYAPRPSCLVPMSEGEREDLLESHRELIADGFEATLIESPRDDALTRSLEPEVVLENATDAICNPFEVCRLLAAGAPDGAIMERTGLTGLDADEQAGTISVRSR